MNKALTCTVESRFLELDIIGVSFGSKLLARAMLGTVNGDGHMCKMCYKIVTLPLFAYNNEKNMFKLHLFIISVHILHFGLLLKAILMYMYLEIGILDMKVVFVQCNMVFFTNFPLLFTESKQSHFTT